MAMNKPEEFEQELIKQKQMYEWLHKGYKSLEERMAKVIDENQRLHYILDEKNTSRFID
jgi:hypothetical protein